MTQQDVIELLKAIGKPLSIIEIASRTGTRPQNVQKNLMRLRKSHEVVVSCPGSHNNGKFYYSVRGDE